MKAALCLTYLFVVILTACSTSAQGMEVTPIVNTVEVTRIVQVTTSPMPIKTRTPAPTLDEMDKGSTAVAKRIGTPIVAPLDCYRTAMTQMELTACAGTRLQGVETQMSKLLKILETNYQERFPQGLEKFQKFHAEWEDLADRECMSRSGLDSDGFAGSMAPMNYYECMTGKYEDRLREYQIQIFEWSY